MIGSILIKGLTMAFGYVYPAYECYKTVEKSKPEIEQLRFWCQYWILVAILTVCERVGDAFVSWVPMYVEAKLAFIIYLWYPNTMGATYVYDAFFRPYIARHENDIDRNLSEFKARAGHIIVLTWQRAVAYSQTRGSEILQYIASQSTEAQPSQPQPQIPSTRPPNPDLNRRKPVNSQPKNKDPQPMPPTASSHNQKDGAAVTGSSNALAAADSVPSAIATRAGASSDNSYHSVPPEAHTTENQEAAPMDYEIADSPPSEIMMEDTETLSSIYNRVRKRPRPRQ